MLDELIEERRKKISRLEKAGLNSYPSRTKRTFLISQARKEFRALSSSKKKIFLAGRLLSWRDQGRIIFADLYDETGRIQIVFKKDNFKNFDFLKETLEKGDFVSAAGPLFKTKKGEESLEVKEYKLLAKTLRPLPSTWYGIEEVETRLRKRYLDILFNPETKELFRKKSLFWQTLRDFLLKEGFLEAETSVLEALPGGAEAEPFKTHHNALDVDFYLRISLELPLKKLLIAGYEKIFEIGRVFRNEGIDAEHLQDYTALEFYWAYHDYNDLMDFVEKMYKAVIKKVTGGLITAFKNKKINWGRKWPKIDYVEIFQKFNHLDPLTASRDELLRKAESLGLAPESYLGRGRLIDLLYKKTVRPTLIQPAFLINPPAELVPLAKRSEKDPRLVERVQVVAGATELGNGFSELNDPIDQRRRFEEQMKLRAKGDKEAQRLDEEFLEALEYGMPPAAGFGLSERLFAVLMDKPVRETVFFPLMRPKKE